MRAAAARLPRCGRLDPRASRPADACPTPGLRRAELSAERPSSQSTRSYFGDNQQLCGSVKPPVPSTTYASPWLLPSCSADTPSLLPLLENHPDFQACKPSNCASLCALDARAVHAGAARRLRRSGRRPSCAGACASSSRREPPPMLLPPFRSPARQTRCRNLGRSSLSGSLPAELWQMTALTTL